MKSWEEQWEPGPSDRFRFIKIRTREVQTKHPTDDLRQILPWLHLLIQMATQRQPTGPGVSHTKSSANSSLSHITTNYGPLAPQEPRD